MNKSDGEPTFVGLNSKKKSHGRMETEVNGEYEPNLMTNMKEE